jgi:hypothetical protein
MYASLPENHVRSPYQSSILRLQLRRRLCRPLLFSLLCHPKQQTFLATSTAQIAERRVVVLQQIIRCVVFQYVAVVEDKDLVKSDHGLQPVCNAEGRDACQVLSQNLLNGFVSFVVYNR